MIYAYTEEKDGRFSFYVSGHAGYAAYGQDVICAGASILTSTLAEVICQLSDYSEVAMVDLKLEPGNTVLSADVGESARERFREATFFFTVGFLMMSETYPKHITFTTSSLDGASFGDRDGHSVSSQHITESPTYGQKGALCSKNI